jgi:hypothetical protein
LPPSDQVKFSAPLSVVKTTMVLSSTPVSYNWFAYEFWRFQFVQKEIGELAQTVIEYPLMQKGASFNLEAVKAQIEKAIAAHAK